MTRPNIRRAVLAGLTAAGLAAVGAGTMTGAAAAAPTGAAVQSDVTTCAATTDSVGRMTCTFGAPLEVKNATDKDGTGTHLDFYDSPVVLSPTGGQANLPGMIYVEGPVLNRDGTAIVGVQLRIFSIRVNPSTGLLAPLANTAVVLRNMANSGDELYCAGTDTTPGNACS